MEEKVVIPETFIQNKNKCFILDFGHGGIENGRYVTAPAKMYDHGDFIFYEGVFNREVGKYLASMLHSDNINYHIITNDQKDLFNTTRARLANEFQEKHKDLDCVYLSIHGNAAGINSATGIEVWTSPGITRSDDYAEVWLEELKDMNWKMRYNEDEYLSRDKESRFTVLMNTDMPSVLVELGFYSNKEQAKLMMNEDIQIKLASLLYRGCKKINNRQ